MLGRDRLHGPEIGVEGARMQLVQRHQALSDDDILARRELVSRAEDVYEEEQVVGGAIADDSSVGARERSFTCIWYDGRVELRGDEVLTAAQQERGNGSRVGNRGGGGRDGGNHDG